MKKIATLPHGLPNPTSDNPFRQLEWLFTAASLASGCSKTTSDTYKSSLEMYKIYLAQSKIPEGDGSAKPFFIQNEWDTLAFHRVKTWVESGQVGRSVINLGANTKSRYLRIIRRVMHYAYLHHFLDQPVSYVSVAGFKKETDSRTAYSNTEVTKIFDAFAPVLMRTIASLNLDDKGDYVFRHYRIRGGGKDPRVSPGVAQHREGEGWKHIENLRWYFENVWQCKVEKQSRENLKRHQSFFVSARSYFGSIEKVYQLLEVREPPDLTELMSLLLKLCAETGLNAESLEPISKIISQQYDGAPE